MNLVFGKLRKPVVLQTFLPCYFQKKECIDIEHTYSRLKSDHSILSSPGKRNKLARKPLRELAGNPETSSNEPPTVRLSEPATGSKGQQSWKSSPTLQWKQSRDKVTGKKFTYINRSRAFFSVYPGNLTQALARFFELQFLHFQVEF